MYSISTYLLSGIISNTQSTGSFQCLGMDNFSFVLSSAAHGNSPATGTYNIEGRVDGSAQYGDLFKSTFAGTCNSGVQIKGPWENLRVRISPFSTGTYTATVRYS